MRHKLIVLCMLLGSGGAALAQSGYGAPEVSIGINLSSYPQMSRVPGYPVYYASGLASNLFFYDGMYWAYQGDNWYASSWYNGPWESVSPDYVPMYVLRVPVRYYRAPPRYFYAWRREAPPRWNEHWGNQWEQHHSGWDRWDRRAMPAPAPLPLYQRQYAGRAYPHAEQQRQLESRNYRYQPRDPIVLQRVRQQPAAAPFPDRGAHHNNAHDNRGPAPMAAPHQAERPWEGRGPQGGNRGEHGPRPQPMAQPQPAPQAQRQVQPPQQQRPQEQEHGQQHARPQQPPQQEQARPQPQPRPPPQVQAQQPPRPQPAGQPPPQPKAEQGGAQHEHGGRGQEKREHGQDKDREGGGEHGPKHDKGDH